MFLEGALGLNFERYISFSLYFTVLNCDYNQLRYYYQYFRPHTEVSTKTLPTSSPLFRKIRQVSAESPSQ